MQNKFKLPKNSDTCLVIKNGNKIEVFSYIAGGLIDIKYIYDNNIFYRNLIILDKINAFNLDLEKQEVVIWLEGSSSEEDYIFDCLEPINANKIYNFFIKSYSFYKTGKMTKVSKSKKKKHKNKVSINYEKPLIDLID